MDKLFLYDLVDEIADNFYLNEDFDAHFISRNELAERFGQYVESAYSSSDNAIYIADDIEDLFVAEFVIAHEMRHAWQYEYHKEKFMDSYRPREQFDNRDDYNLQLAEIDANAWALVFMIQYFHKYPKFENNSEVVRQTILEYACKEFGLDRRIVQF